MEATAATLERRVRVIPATRKPEELHRDHDGKMRVAAYCRVSTDSEEQLNSYEAQKTYYTQKIQDSPDWEMAGIYADATVIIGLKQNPTYGRRFSPIFLFIRAFCGAKRKMLL